MNRRPLTLFERSVLGGLVAVSLGMAIVNSVNRSIRNAVEGAWR